MEGPNASPVRSSLWLDDGSVVIQAELTQFRVHRTMLSRHSQVFRDMFSVPQPLVHSEDNIEGCPIVHLSDSAQDVSHLLSALYDQVYTTRDPLPFSVLAAMLRLGSKYEINHLREDALFRLRAEFPTTLDNWDDLSEEYTHIVEQGGILYDIINLAIEQGLWSILPSAYYNCILTGKDENIFKGQTREDGSRVVLLPEAQHAYFLGRQKIQEQQATTTLLWLSDDVPMIHCTSPQQCAKNRCALSISIFKPVADPSRSLQSWADVDNKESLCESCLEDAEDMHDKGRKAMWKKMPEIFGFPPWKELKKMDR